MRELRLERDEGIEPDRRDGEVKKPFSPDPDLVELEGLAAARARGRTGGRKPKLNARQAATVRRMYAATGPDGKRQHTVAEIAEAVGVHRTTVYDYLKKED